MKNSYGKPTNSFKHPLALGFGLPKKASARGRIVALISLVLLLVFAGVLATPQKAYAFFDIQMNSADVSWVNETTLQVVEDSSQPDGGIGRWPDLVVNYIDSNPTDSNRSFVREGISFCDNGFKDTITLGNTPSAGTFTYATFGSQVGDDTQDCSGKIASIPVAITDVENAIGAYNCGAAPPDQQQACEEARTNSNSFFAESCDSPNPTEPICVGSTTPEEPIGFGEDTRIGCPEDNDNPLNWVMCPIITYAMSGISGIDIAINNLLNIGTEQIFDDSTQTGEAYRTAWAIFRGFALAFIVIAALIMVISQAAGLEILDAYTIRKVLPKLLIAAIGITLSWELMEAAIILFNDLGQGVRDIIRQPFQDIFEEAAVITGGTSFIVVLLTTGAIFAYGLLALLSFVVTILIAVVIAFAMLVFREIVIIFLVITAPIFIALYVLPNTQKFSNFGFKAFFGLLLAYPIIMGTIAVGDVFSVVAASSDVGLGYITNNAAGVLGFATYSVSHAALASGTMAVGEVFGQGSVTGQIVGVVAFIASRAAIIPIIAFSFSMAGALGAAMGRMGASAAQRGQGKVGGWRQKRGATVRGNRGERIKTGNIFKRADNGPGWWRGIKTKVNTGAAAVSNVGSAGANPLKWRSNIREAMERTTEQQRDAMGKDEDWTWQNDDDLNRAAAESEGEGDLRDILLSRDLENDGGRYGWNGKTFVDKDGKYDPEGEKNLQRDLARVRRMKDKYGNHSFRQAAHLKAVAGGAAYESPDDPYKAVARIAGGNAGLRANLVGATRSAAAQAGRQDQAAMSYGTALSGTTALHRYMTGAPGGQSPDEVSKKFRRGAAESADPHQIVRGKGRSTAAIAKGHAEIITDMLENIGQERTFEYFDENGKMQKETRPIEEKDVKQAMGAAMGVLDALGGTGSVHGKNFARNLMGMPLTREDAAKAGVRLSEDVSETTVSRLFDHMRDDPDIKEISRQYATAAAAEAARSGAPPTEG